MYNKAAADLAIEGCEGMSGPLVLVTLYEPTSQMRRAAVEPSATCNAK
jgi:hypothetical protein